MEIRKILKEIEDNDWCTESAPGHLAFLIAVPPAFTGIRHHIPLPYMSMNMFIYQRGIMWEKIKEKEKIAVFLWIIEKMKKDPTYAKKLLKKQRILEKVILKIFSRIDKEELSRISDKRLWEVYNEFYKNYVVYVEIVAIPESGDPVVEHYLLPLLREKEHIKEEEINEVIMVFSTPPAYSFMEKEHIDLLKLSISYLKANKDMKKIKKKLGQHSKKYFYTKNNYERTYYLNENHFMEKIEEEIKGKAIPDIQKEIAAIKKAKQILKEKKSLFRKKYRLSKETRLIFRAYGVMGQMIDERKRRMIMANHYIAKLNKEIARRKNLGWLEINYYTVLEIEALLLKNKRVPKGETERRYECCAHISDLNKNFIVSGDEAKQILEAFNRKIKGGTVKGMVANKSREKLIGEVCIVIDPYKDKFPEGRVLVTTMTRPDFVPLIKKAKAIITDEGGVTSHAAVVSREFGIPCIIGTKNATRMLKTGYKVEVDTDKGYVKIIKREGAKNNE